MQPRNLRLKAEATGKVFTTGEFFTGSQGSKLRQTRSLSAGQVPKQSMGDVTVAAFVVLTTAALALVGFGFFRRARAPVVAGAALLVSLAGAWVVGLPGAAAGLVALPFLRRGRSRLTGVERAD